MLHTIKNILKQSAIYGLGKISGRIVGFILLPLYTEKISVADYGVYALFEAIIQFGAVVFGFGLKGALFRWLNIIDDSKKRGAIIFTSLIWMTGISVFIVVIGFYFKATFARLMFGSGAYTYLINYVFILIGLEIIRSILFTLVRIYQKSVLYSTISVLSVFLNLGFNVYLIVYLNMGIEGILISSIISSLFITVVLLFFFVKKLYLKIESRVFGEMLKYGFPLIFSTIASSAIVFGDRFIIELFLPLESVGKYTFVYKIAGIVNIFLIQSFLLAWPAIAWQNIKKPDPENFMKKMVTYFVFISTWATLVLSVFSKDIIFMLASNPDYGDAYNIVPIISFSFVFYGVYHIIGFSLHFKNKTKYFAYFVALSAGLNILLNYILIPLYGLTGAASATFFAYLTLALSCYISSKRFFPVQYEFAKIFSLLATAFVLLIIYLLLRNIFEGQIFYINILLSFLFPLIVYYLRLFDVSELKKFRPFKNRR